MQKISNLLPKIQRVKKVKDRQPALFETKLWWDWRLVNKNQCPKCALSLYWNRPRTIIRCKSRLHSFVLTAKAYQEIVSGKRLEEWKENDKMNRR